MERMKLEIKKQIEDELKKTYDLKIAAIQKTLEERDQLV